MKICYRCFRRLNDEDEVCPFCGEQYSAEPIEPIHLRPGTVLNNRYFLGRVVGGGGFGIVYRAFDQKLQRIVAVKEFFVPRLMTRAVGEDNVIVFRSEKTKDEYEYRISRFLAEARTMAMFNSNSNIPEVFAYYEENHTAYIVMELLEGMTLSQYLHGRNGVVDVDFALMVATQVANALRSLHEKKVLHLDVAPDNIFICSGKEIKLMLIDLGAAKLADGEQEVIDKILKPGYSPEELYNDLNNIGPWSDTYALGATMYRMLTGAPPDEATNRKIEDRVRPVNEINPSVPENLSNTIMRSIALERHLRFQDVESFVKAIENKKKIRDPRSEKKHRRFIRMASVICSVLILGIMGNMTYKYVVNKAVEEEAVLNDATINVWYCVNEGSNEENAMNEVKKNFTNNYGNVNIVFRSYGKDEYLEVLEAAANTNSLPTLYESTDAPEDVIRKSRALNNVYNSSHLNSTLFLRDTSSRNSKQIPLGIEVPVACVITNGNTYIDYNKDYFGRLEDFGPGTKIAVAKKYEDMARQNFGNYAFADEKTFFDEYGNESAVLITSTGDINRIMNELPKVTKRFVYYDADQIFCDYTYKWSIGSGDSDQIVAAERLLEWMLEEVDQNYLMISYNNEGQLPVNRTCFMNKISENDFLKPIEKIYDRFVFR